MRTTVQVLKSIKNQGTLSVSAHIKSCTRGALSCKEKPESQINIEKILFPIWLQPQAFALILRAGLFPGFSLIQLSRFTPLPPISPNLNSDWPGTTSIVVSQARARVQPKGQEVLYTLSMMSSEGKKTHLLFMNYRTKHCPPHTDGSSCLRDPVRFINCSKVHKNLRY